MNNFMVAVTLGNTSQRCRYVTGVTFEEAGIHLSVAKKNGYADAKVWTEEDFTKDCKEQGKRKADARRVDREAR